MHSYSFYSADPSFREEFVPRRVCRAVDQFSQAVLSFMYEAGLLIVSGEDNIVTVVPDGSLASCREVIAYDDACENDSAVEALNRLQEEGLAECDWDDAGRRLYRLSFKGQSTARSLCFRRRL